MSVRNPDRPGSAEPRAAIARKPNNVYERLVQLGLRLNCMYGADPCDDHLGEDGFTRCQPCVTRDEAERLVR